MTKILDLSGREFKITVINMLKVLVERMGNMREQMGNFSREIEAIRKSLMKMLEIKNSNRNK